jgi:hypothetical protein
LDCFREIEGGMIGNHPIRHRSGSFASDVDFVGLLRHLPCCPINGTDISCTGIEIAMKQSERKKLIKIGNSAKELDQPPVDLFGKRQSNQSHQ